MAHRVNARPRVSARWEKKDHRTSCGGNTFFLEAMNMTNRILRLPDVLDLTGLARSTIYAKIAAGQFPKPFKLGQRAVGWLEADVDSWIETKVLESELAR